MATPAYAATVELDGAHRQLLAREVTQSCAEGTDRPDPRMAARRADQDGWFFEVGAGDIVSLTVTFAPAGVPDGDPAEQVLIAGAVGDPAGPIVFYPAGPFVPHAYVFAPAGWLLVTATAEVERGSRLILRHACAGEPAAPPTPGATPSPSPGATPTPTPSVAPTATPGTPPPAGAGPGLVVTGAQVGGMVVLGTGLLAAGVAMMAVRRRRAVSDLLDG